MINLYLNMINSYLNTINLYLNMTNLYLNAMIGLQECHVHSKFLDKYDLRTCEHGTYITW